MGQNVVRDSWKKRDSWGPEKEAKRGLGWPLVRPEKIWLADYFGATHKPADRAGDAFDDNPLKLVRGPPAPQTRLAQLVDLEGKVLLQRPCPVSLTCLSCGQVSVSGWSCLAVLCFNEAVTIPGHAPGGLKSLHHGMCQSLNDGHSDQRRWPIVVRWFRGKIFLPQMWCD